jgi:hypothetical protein
LNQVSTWFDLVVNQSSIQFDLSVNQLSIQFGFAVKRSNQKPIYKYEWEKGSTRTALRRI